MSNQYCNGCNQIKPQSDFDPLRGITCVTCLNKNNKMTQTSIEIRRKQAQAKGMEFCQNCRTEKNPSEFGKRKSGEYNKNCSQCLLKKKIQREEKNQKEPKKDPGIGNKICTRCGKPKPLSKYRLSPGDAGTIYGELNGGCNYCLDKCKENDKIYRENRTGAVTIDPNQVKCNDCLYLKHESEIAVYTKNYAYCITCRNKVTDFHNSIKNDITKTAQWKIKQYAKRDKEMKREFNITRQDFLRILFDSNGYCHYCMQRFNLKNLGLDRKYNQIGHIKGNVVACCRSCNNKKRTISYDEFKKYYTIQGNSPGFDHNFMVEELINCIRFFEGILPSIDEKIIDKTGEMFCENDEKESEHIDDLDKLD